MTLENYESGTISVSGVKYDVLYTSNHSGTTATLAMAIRNIASPHLNTLEHQVEAFFRSISQIREERPDNVKELFPQHYPLKEYEKTFKDGRIVVTRWDASNRRSESVNEEYGFLQIFSMMKNWQQPSKGNKHIMYVMREHLEPEQTELVLEQFYEFMKSAKKEHE